MYASAQSAEEHCPEPVTSLAGSSAQALLQRLASALALRPPFVRARAGSRSNTTSSPVVRTGCNCTVSLVSSCALTSRFHCMRVLTVRNDFCCMPRIMQSAQHGCGALPRPVIPGQHAQRQFRIAISITCLETIAVSINSKDPSPRQKLKVTILASTGYTPQPIARLLVLLCCHVSQMGALVSYLSTLHHS